MNHQDDSLTIGQVAKHAGVGVETIRFYEREGLIDKPERRPSGYRQYPSSVIDRIQFIRHAKQLGFSLGEIGDMFALQVDSANSCRDVREKAQEKIDEIEQKMASLERIRVALQRLVEKCNDGTTVEGCPILDEFERGPTYDSTCC